MQLKRYTMQSFSPKDYPPPLFVPHKRGRYVLYSDAQSRIQSLEAALRACLNAMTECVRLDNGMRVENDKAMQLQHALSNARQALGDL